MTTVETFEHIILHQSSKELVPFLLGLGKADIVPVRKKAQKLKKELQEYKEYEVKPGRTQWRSLITPEQSSMLFLAGLATYSRKEALTNNFSISGYLNISARGRAEQDIVSLVHEVLDHAQPVWLTEWLVRNARTSWAVPDFGVLIDLNKRKLIETDNWLLAQATARHLHSLGSEIGTARTLAMYKAAGTKLNPLQTTMWAQLQVDRPHLVAGLSLPTFEQMIVADLRADTDLLQTGIPLLFDYDTPVDSASTYNTQGKVNTIVSWLDVLPQLVESGHLDRADLLTRSLLSLRRDFRRPLLTWFKNLFLALKPTKAERLARQSELVELLAHPLPLVVNFALDQLKDLWAEPEFTPAPLLLYAEGLMTRQDLKTTLRTLLGAFEKLLKREPTLASTLARLSTSALANADAAVQERAAKLLTGIIGAKKPLLTADETIEITDTIGLYADLLAAAARTVLAPYLADGSVASADGAATTYVPQQTDFVPDISAATAIAPVQDWHELLFLTGQVLQNDNPTAMERWLDGLLRLRPQFPANYAQQLRPYLQQAFPWVLKDKTEAETVAALLGQDFGNSHNGQRELIQALLISWFTEFESEKVSKVPLTNHQYSNPDPLLRVEQQRLAAVEEQLRTVAKPLPQLSTPSHTPHWVAPSVLVEKLLAYQYAGQTPAAADLTLALTRTAFRTKTDAAIAQQRLPQLQDGKLRELLHWFLAPTTEPTSIQTPVVTGKSVVKVLTERLSKLIPIRYSNVPSSLPDALPWLWAVAARTRFPDAALPALQPLTDYPGVAAPWQPGWHFEQKSHTYKQTWNKEQPEVTHTWQELCVPTDHEGQLPPSPLLLYSLHARLKQKDQYYIWSLVPNLPFLLSMLPNNPAPLHWHVLRTACRTDDQGSEGRDLLQHVLNSLLGPGPRFNHITSALLAVGLTHQAPVCRGVALEVLLSAVEHRRLLPAALGAALGKLLAAEFVPVQRLADNLAQARAISPATDDALRQTLNELLPLLPATPLRNTRKLIEAYADLQGRTRQEVPTAVQTRLREWSQSATLKKAVGSLV